MNAMGVEIRLELVELALQVHGIAEEYAIEVFAPEGSDQSFNERMRHPGVRNRLDPIDLEHAYVGEPNGENETADRDRGSGVSVAAGL